MMMQNSEKCNDDQSEPSCDEDGSVRCLVEKSQHCHSRCAEHSGPVRLRKNRPSSLSHDSGLLMKGWKRLLSQLDSDRGERSRDTVDGKRRSAAIDRYLDAESQKMKRQLRVLLFGDMGQKDIFWKQVRLLEQPLSEKEREGLRLQVRRVVLDSVRSCLWAALDRIHEKSKGRESEAETKRAMDRFKAALYPYRESQDEDTVEHIAALCADPELQLQLMLHGLTFADIELDFMKLEHDSFYTCPCTTNHSLVQQLHRVYAPDYIPTEHDWFHFDRRRLGPLLREAKVQEVEYSLILFEITRLSSERRKWIHLFDDTTAIVFVFDLAYYDECLLEDQSYNRFKESLVLFDSICGSRWFCTRPILAIVSNVQAFRSKLTNSPLSRTFPDYAGDDSDAALDYIIRKVKETANERKGLHVRLCDVVTRVEVQATLQSMEETILKDAIRAIDELPKPAKNGEVRSGGIR